jgi:hypothetical protein
MADYYARMGREQEERPGQFEAMADDELERAIVERFVITNSSLPPAA